MPKPKSRKPRKPPVKIPAKGQKCEKVEMEKEAFHEGSFRYTQSGSAAVMVGCPLEVEYERGDRAGKTVKTVWRPDRAVGQQCVQVRTGTPVGLRAHVVLVPKSRGACRSGYRKA